MCSSHVVISLNTYLLHNECLLLANGYLCHLFLCLLMLYNISRIRLKLQSLANCLHTEPIFSLLYIWVKKRVVYRLLRLFLCRFFRQTQSILGFPTNSLLFSTSLQKRYFSLGPQLLFLLLQWTHEAVVPRCLQSFACFIV